MKETLCFVASIDVEYLQVRSVSHSVMSPNDFLLSMRLRSRTVNPRRIFPNRDSWPDGRDAESLSESAMSNPVSRSYESMQVSQA